jgi:hypothetical protein
VRLEWLPDIAADSRFQTGSRRQSGSDSLRRDPSGSGAGRGTEGRGPHATAWLPDRALRVPGTGSLPPVKLITTARLERTIVRLEC